MNIKDYLHLYIGCEIIGEYQDEQRNGYLTGLHGEYGPEIQFFTEDEVNVHEHPEYNDYDQVKLILRPLSDINQEDMNAVSRSMHMDDKNYVITCNTWKPEEFMYLLSKGFDLFGLIEAGLAIDKTKQ